MRRCAKIDEYLFCSRKLWAPYQQSCGKTLHEKSNLSQMWLTLQGSKETQVINDDNHLIWMFKSKQMQCSYSFSLGSQNWFLPKYWHSLFLGKPIHQSLPNLLHHKKVLLRYYNGRLTYTYFDASEFRRARFPRDNRYSWYREIPICVQFIPAQFADFGQTFLSKFSSATWEVHVITFFLNWCRIIS